MDSVIVTYNKKTNRYTSKNMMIAINEDNTLHIGTAMGNYELHPAEKSEGIWYGVCNDHFVAVSKEKDSMSVIYQ